MEPSLYRYILKHSKKDQIALIILSLVSLPLVYITLELPKKIINLLEGLGVPTTLFGTEYSQLHFLLILSGAFLLAVLINGAIKYVLNVYRGALGERLLRRLRYELYEHLLRFPIPLFKRVSQGELIPMITAETEPLAEFIGESYSLPVFQGGILLTYVFFIFQQDVLLGFAAISLYPFQLYVIPKLQKKVNLLAKQRVSMVRSLSGRIGETVSGIVEVHANDTSQFERAQIGHRLGIIYNIRFAIYRRKFFIKFLNNFIAQLTPFFFYSAGGYFVLRGDLSIGSMVAVLVAYKDLSGPWKELLRYYQRKEDIKIKYTQVINQFDPPSILDADVIDQRPDSIKLPGQELLANHIGYSEDGLFLNIDSANFKLDLKSRTAVVGLGNSGKEELALLIARLLNPTSGNLSMNGDKWSNLPEAITGHRLGYTSANSYLFTGSVMENLIYSLRHLPVSLTDDLDAVARENEKDLSVKSGNSIYRIEDNWIDLSSIGLQSEQALLARIIEILRIVELDEEIYQFGLLSRVDQAQDATLAARIMQARHQLHDEFQQPGIVNLVEPFDRDLYNTNMTVAENLLFGTIYGDAFDETNISEHPVIRDVLQRADLTNDFLQAGYKIAEVMIDLFSDVESDSELFERFSFIEADHLPEFHQLLSRAENQAFDKLKEEDHARLLSLPFKLVVARHRLGLIDESVQKRILKARAMLHDAIDQKGLEIEFFEKDRYNPRVSVQDNILFGKLVYGQANAQQKINSLISGVISTLGLQDDIIRAGLDYEVGVGGSRLTSMQRQKTGLARSLLKSPDLLVVNEALSGLDATSERRIIQKIISSNQSLGLFWVLGRSELAELFENVFVMERGKLQDKGSFEDIKVGNEHFRELLP
jgi:putative ABC transport system ATP-binding protein